MKFLTYYIIKSTTSRRETVEVEVKHS